VLLISENNNYDDKFSSSETTTKKCLLTITLISTDTRAVTSRHLLAPSSCKKMRVPPICDKKVVGKKNSYMHHVSNSTS